MGTKLLKAAIAKVQPVASSLQPDLEASVREKLIETPIADKLMKVIVDTNAAPVVAYVQWRCGEEYNREIEASYAAWAVGSVTELVGVLGVWCVDDKDTKIFSARIGQPNLTRISMRGIARFAKTRYWRLFEKKKLGPHV